jgi:hypothetical protein
VPIFTALRHDDDDPAANRFGRTVLTAAVVVMAITAAVLIVAAPLIAAAVAGSLSAADQALYVDLFRINCLTLTLFAASIAIGEILVANRRLLLLRPRSGPLPARGDHRDAAVRRHARRLRAGLGHRSPAPLPTSRPGRPARSGRASATDPRSGSGLRRSASSSG